MTVKQPCTIVSGWLKILVIPVIVACVASCGSDKSTPQSVAAYGDSVELVTRVGEFVSVDLLASIEPMVDDNRAAFIASIRPGLPVGLTVNFATGELSGTATETVADTRFDITVQDGDESRLIAFDLAVNIALPEAFDALQTGFSAELLVADAAVPVRMAVADDGRLFYAELMTGNVRVVDPHTGLLDTPFVTVPVVSGFEKGLIGLALDPDFSNNHYVYVNATVQGHDGQPDHAEIIRYTAQGNRGVSPTVIVDHLPVADLHNGGDIVFDRHGHLFIGRGDIEVPALSQLDGSLSGKILRYTAEGAIPRDNPFPDDPEWSRGLRNTFAMALNPRTGDLFGADAGPDSDDKLNYLQAGKNFTWGLEEEPQGSGIGYSLDIWDEVITPTGLLFSNGAGRFAPFVNELFVSSYNFDNIQVMYLDGDADTDVIRQAGFASFQTDGNNSKPLHVAQDSQGSLYVSTFNAIYRIY